MSTLKVNTIQDTSGSNGSTSEQISKGRAKVWVNFKGSGTLTVNESFNVSSVTDNGTGNYTINYSSALSSAEGCSVMGGGRGDSNFNMHVETDTTPSASSIHIKVSYDWAGGGANANDATRAYVAVFND